MIRARHALMFAALGFACLQVDFAEASPPTVLDPEALLLSNLQQRYPGVTRWDVRPLGERAPQDSEVAAEMAVVLLGVRSGVRVNRRVYWYQAAGFQTVLAAAHDVRAGEALEPRDGRPLDEDVVAAGCPPLTKPEALTGQRARRTLKAGSVICASALETRPWVARGDEVTVRYVGAHITLTMKAVAEGDGQAGAMLQVRNPDSRERFAAQVSGPKEVTIHE